MRKLRKFRGLGRLRVSRRCVALDRSVEELQASRRAGVSPRPFAHHRLGDDLHRFRLTDPGLGHNFLQFGHFCGFADLPSSVACQARDWVNTTFSQYPFPKCRGFTEAGRAGRFGRMVEWIALARTTTTTINMTF